MEITYIAQPKVTCQDFIDILEKSTLGLRRFFFQKLAFLDFLDMPICEKVHISSYLGIFQMRAAAAAATTTAASQELSPFGKTPGVPRAGTKYPVQGNPSLRQRNRSEAFYVTSSVDV